MNVKVKLFAAARELSGVDEITVEVSAGATIADVRTAVLRVVPRLQQIVALSLWAIDANYADDNDLVRADSEVALIPPVSGG